MRNALWLLLNFPGNWDLVGTPRWDKDGSWWLHCNWLKSPEQQSTQTWAPTLKQTHLKNKQCDIAMASTCKYFWMSGHQWWMVGKFSVWSSIYFIWKGSLLNGIPTNHLALKNQLSRPPQNWWIHSCRALGDSPVLEHPGILDLPPCEVPQTSSNNLTKWNNTSHAALTTKSFCKYLGCFKEFLKEGSGTSHHLRSWVLFFDVFAVTFKISSMFELSIRII